MLRSLFLYFISFAIIGCGGGGEDGRQAGTVSPSFATVIENSAASKSTPMSSPPTFQLDEVVQAIKNANLTSPEKIYSVAVAAELSVAQMDALFVLPAGTAAAFIAKRTLPPPKASATIVGLQLSQLPVSLTQVRQIMAGSALADKEKLYVFGRMENLSAFDLNKIASFTNDTFENFIATTGKAPLASTNRIISFEPVATQVEVTEIPDLMLKKGWSTAAAMMNRWFDGKGGTYTVTFANVEAVYGDLTPAIDGVDWRRWPRQATVGDELIPSDSYKPFLVDELRKLANSAGQKILLHGGNFDFMRTEAELFAQTETYNTGQKSETSTLHYFGEKTVKRSAGYLLLNGFDEFTAAYNNITLRLLASGKVTVSDSGLATIHISNTGVYVRDSYDFIDENSTESQSLGYWSKSDPFVSWFPVGISGWRQIRNIDFNNYNSNLEPGWRGANYRIMSTIKIFPQSPDASFVYQLTPAEMSERNTSAAPVIPAVPVLSLVGKTANSVSLQWTNPVGATYYVLNRSGIDSNRPNSSSFVDSGVTPSTAYTYTIKACNITGCSAASSVLSVTTPP